ncbi:MAG: hypothetical protein D6710_08230, partial [Nitrospirae bacterium]
ISSFKVVDVDLEDKVVKKTYYNTVSEGTDIVSEFLVGASSFAGLLLAGYMVDIFNIGQIRVTPFNEIKSWSAQGLPAAVALLIELGINYAAVKLLFDNSQNLDTSVEQQFIQLSNDPDARKKVLTEAGYDYEAIRGNQRILDYKQVKEYCLSFISKTYDSVRYDHWLAWLQVLETQSIVKSSLAMAPTFSDKWKKFAQRAAVGEDITGDDVLEVTTTQQTSPFGGLKSTLTQGVKDYLSSVLTLSNEAYNNTASAFYMQIDERALCCILYFLGPIDATDLASISNMLKLGTFKLNLNVKELLSFLTESSLSSLLSMLANYLSQILDKVVKSIMDAMFSVPDTDLEVTVKLCAGMDMIYKIFDASVDFVGTWLEDVVKNLNNAIYEVSSRQFSSASIYADRRALITMISLIDAIIAKLDSVKDICKVDPDNADEIINDSAAEAAVDFVVNELPSLFPVLELSEDVRRKHFSGAQGFVTETFGIQVPGFGPSGEPLSISDSTNAVEDCSKNSPAQASVVLGQRLANAFRIKQ